MRIGILGGGQLGRMLALAGAPLGLRCRFMDPSPYAPAGHVGELVLGDYQDTEALERFVRDVDVVTYEFENVPIEPVQWLAQRVPVYPPVDALRVGQDRLLETEFFTKAGLDVHRKAPLEDGASVDAVVKHVGLPCVIKTRRGGYDGKGQTVARSGADVQGALDRLGARGLMFESFVPFTRELSLVGVRGRDGSFKAYPLVQNHHEGGILRTTIAPATDVPAAIVNAAHAHVRALMSELGYVGVLAVEFFEHEGRLLANEMAPRVHNSGHWTMDGAETSQFENHMRAVAGLPLGSCAARGHSVMVNLIGGWPPITEMLAVPGAKVHLYGKEPRPGRKVGHVNVWGESAAHAAAGAARISSLISQAK